MDKKIKTCKKIYQNYQKLISNLEIEHESTHSENEKNNLKNILSGQEKALCQFIRNEYASVIFNIYSHKNPKIKDVYTGEVKYFNEIFGVDFDKIPAHMREGIVGIIEGYGAFKLK